MKNYLFSLFSSFFSKNISQLKTNSYHSGYEFCRTERNTENEKIRIFELEEMIGKPVICISNEWENPVIGFATGIDYITLAKCPVLSIKDYVTNEQVQSFGKMFVYTDQRFNAIYKLDPFERCSLIYNSFYHDEEFVKEKHHEIHTLEEIKSILKENGFYIKINEYQNNK